MVEISDTGPGIPPAVLKRLFEPFFTTKPIGIGTGLGLTICLNIVKELQGELTVDTRMGKGTTFRVVLPAARTDQPVEPTPSPNPAVPTVRRLRILLVDDEPFMGVVIERTLRGLHDVVSLPSAREALQRVVGGEHFDLIISDVMMPTMGGAEFYKALLKVAPAHAARMMFLTGGLFGEASRFLDDLPNARIEKPFEPQALRVLIQQFAGGLQSKA
ncbi:MAG TPA: ATP-binding protein [Plantibacter sp.]|uniref:ATP-binding protein n=1 Tax=Plantibacter sp. TaxID=1871045 RepID=UPI002C08F7A3|nr:ATP-binding protein [Plantibacter sp.]